MARILNGQSGLANAGSRKCSPRLRSGDTWNAAHQYLFHNGLLHGRKMGAWPRSLEAKKPGALEDRLLFRPEESQQPLAIVSLLPPPGPSPNSQDSDIHPCRWSRKNKAAGRRDRFVVTGPQKLELQQGAGTTQCLPNWFHPQDSKTKTNQTNETATNKQNGLERWLSG